MKSSYPFAIKRPQAQDLGYSLRRHYVDQFHLRHVHGFPAGGLILDLGGNRIGKRGLFDIGRFPLQVVYANLSAAKRPDVQTDAATLPFRADTLDGVICSELLEHVLDPIAVVREIHRVLKPDGLLLICVPFLNRIHGDPYDYGRYSDFYWREILSRMGFMQVSIEKHGYVWSVLADLLRDLAYEKTTRGWARSAWAIRRMAALMAWCKCLALAWDERVAGNPGTVLQAYTTGFGITARKG